MDDTDVLIERISAAEQRLTLRLEELRTELDQMGDVLASLAEIVSGYLRKFE